MIKKLFFTLCSAVILSGCSTSIDGELYRDIQPDFKLESFFEGNVKAWGIVQDRDGNLVQRFIVDIDGTINANNQLVLDETFSYGVGDGVEKRIWTITPEGNNTYSGTASDILNQAEGQIYGNALHWKYEMDLPVGDTTYRVEFDDWMWKFDDTTLMNRSYIKKFGLVMAEVTIFMQKQ